MFKSAKSSLFTRLGTMANSGVTWPEALRRCARSARGGQKANLNLAADLFDAGGEPRAIYEQTQLFSEFERELLVGGHMSGQIPQICQSLSEYHTGSAKRNFVIVSALAYPMLLLHVVTLVSSILGAPSIPAFFGRFVIRLLLLWTLIAIPFIGYYVLRATAATRPVFDRFLLAIPFVGRYVLVSETGHSLLSLAYLYRAGINIVQATGQISRLSDNACLADVWSRVEDRLANGETLSAALASEGDLPVEAIDYIGTGESSGKLEEMLFKASTELKTEATRLMTAIIAVTTMLAFGIAVLAAAYTIISFWLGYFEKINKVLGK